jgi:hypothetical protein
MSPLSSANFAALPSALTVGQLKQQLFFMHSNALPHQHFTSHTRLAACSKLISPYMAAGGSVEHINYNAGKITHVSASYSYSTVLLNQFRLHIGVSAQLISYSLPVDNVIDFYTTPSLVLDHSSALNGMMNYSITLAALKNRVQFSFAHLNALSMHSNSVIPQYYVVQVGNLLRLFNLSPHQVVELFYCKRMPYPTSSTIHNVQARTQLSLPLNRHLALLYGGSVGWHSVNFFQYSPLLGLSTRTMNYGITYNGFSHFNVFQHPALLGVFFNMTFQKNNSPNKSIRL